MSRETDSPSSGPNGRGGAAYPSGTPPYGIPVVSDGGADAGRSAAQPEERKTETTLTTRIRINIPGSRPIPPVVVRQPVADTEGVGEDTGAEVQAAAAAPAAGSMEPPAEPAPSAEEKTSDWFAPRKSAPNKGGQGGGATNGAGMPGASAAGAPAGIGAPSGAGSGPGPGTGGGPRPGGPGAARPTGAGAPGAGRPGGVVGSMAAPGSRPGSTIGAGLPGATGGPVAPGHGGGTGSFDVTEALAVGPLGGASGPGPGGGPESRRDDLPYFSEGGANGPQGQQNSQQGQSGHSGQQGQSGQNGFAGPTGQGGPTSPGNYENFSDFGDFSGHDGPGGPGGHGGQQGPAGPTTGPVTGNGPIVPPVNNGMAGAASAGAAAGLGTGRLPGGGLSDDTAILTPQKQVPDPGVNGGYGRHDNVSGHTLTSGIPVIPPAERNAPFAPAEGARQHTPPKLPEPAAQSAPAADSKKKKKKGRSKLVLLAGLVVFGGVGVYGAGLLMNHSDVPKGTTVLGVDIGGGTRDEAVKKLDQAFDKRVNQALKLSVDGDTVTLKPDQAGLQFDMQATVDAAARSDYNPVSVIGSLFGQKREIEPKMPVDEEKLAAALETAAGGAGSATDGTIKFQSGKAVAVYGKAGKGIDATQATAAVEEAYRTQVETGTGSAVKVPTTAKQPTISNAEVDRMMKAFAEPAMSAKVTVRTDADHTVSFSPENSLWKFLQVKAIDGKLVESYDEAALKKLYGGTFDGVLIARGTGQKTAVTVKDVIGALRLVLTKESDRVAVIDTDPS